MVIGAKTGGGNAEERGNLAYRMAAGLAIVEALVLLWINVAAGIIGDGPVNLLYLGVMLIGSVGAALARLQPRGLTLALCIMAFGQMMVPLVALVIWKAGRLDWLVDPNSPHPPFHPGVGSVFGLNMVFALFWVVSARLFWKAACEHTDSGNE